MSIKNRIYYYKSYNDDFVKSKKQDYKLCEEYVWIHKNIFYRILSWVVYKIATVFCFFYCKFCLKVTVKNRDVLKKYKKSGYFLFGNHTQVVGDVFIPTYVCNGKRIYIVVSPANLGIPVLGKILPMLGALPIPDSIHRLGKFKSAVDDRVKNGNTVVVYPEGHLWPYYTKIRPFSPDAFRFPVENDMPTFSITSTYQKPKHGDKPNITVFVDGPFFADKSLTVKDKRQNLRNKVYDKMVERSKNSTYEYVHYEEEKVDEHTILR